RQAPARARRGARRPVPHPGDGAAAAHLQHVVAGGAQAPGGARAGAGSRARGAARAARAAVAGRGAAGARPDAVSARVAVVIPWFGRTLRGGAEEFAWQNATRLARRGHEVEVLTTCGAAFQA